MLLQQLGVAIPSKRLAWLLLVFECAQPHVHVVTQNVPACLQAAKGKPAGKAGDAESKKPTKPAAEATASQPPSRPASGKPRAKGKT